ncbi:hypothetical protein BDN72DRAFT_955954 [Pluteus cervinus]|uniref:Uncharacterized protein n=1 Tax=Pluteus cervinus TaxID=181527 RepID=A0ACD3B8B8_9AGAR|nr:hypothetical protein BDN72DRAFT_955954 [Pluteus cervinus]
MTSQDPIDSQFEPNFSSTYSITLNHPITTVFPILGTKEGHERVSRLATLCTSVQLDEEDEVAIPMDKSLKDVYVRTWPAAATPNVGNDSDSNIRRVLPRQHFTMEETVPILFGFYKSVVPIKGTLTWDPTNYLALYESIAGPSIRVWKLRTFEEVVDSDHGDGSSKTRLTEEIRGKCPGWMKLIVQNETTKAHVAQMNIYHTLFSDLG